MNEELEQLERPYKYAYAKLQEVYIAEFLIKEYNCSTPYTLSYNGEPDIRFADGTTIELKADYSTTLRNLFLETDRTTNGVNTLYGFPRPSCTTLAYYFQNFEQNNLYFLNCQTLRNYFLGTEYLINPNSISYYKPGKNTRTRKSGLAVPHTKLHQINSITSIITIPSNNILHDINNRFLDSKNKLTNNEINRPQYFQRINMLLDIIQYNIDLLARNLA